MRGRHNQELGRAGESKAAEYLAARGYRIIARNVRFRIGEIDLVAEVEGCLVFVEVKTRSGLTYGTGAEAVNVRKRVQLIKLAELYLASQGGPPRSCRFDVVSLIAGADGSWQVELIQNAFSAS